MDSSPDLPASLHLPRATPTGLSQDLLHPALPPGSPSAGIVLPLPTWEPMSELGSPLPHTPDTSGLQDFSHLSIPLPTAQLQPWLRPFPQGPQSSTLLMPSGPPHLCHAAPHFLPGYFPQSPTNPIPHFSFRAPLCCSHESRLKVLPCSLHFASTSSTIPRTPHPLPFVHPAPHLATCLVPPEGAPAPINDTDIFIFLYTSGASSRHLHKTRAPSPTGLSRAPLPSFGVPRACPSFLRLSRSPSLPAARGRAPAPLPLRPQRGAPSGPTPHTPGPSYSSPR